MVTIYFNLKVQVFLYLSVVIVIVNISVIGALPVERSAGKTPFGFDDVVASNKFPLKGFNGTWISGNIIEI